MSHQIIKQTDGRYAIFSTESETIIVWDATADEVSDWFVQLATQNARRSVHNTIAEINAGTPERIYGRQRTMTWEQALRVDREHGGKASSEPTARIQLLEHISDEKKRLIIAKLQADLGKP